MLRGVYQCAAKCSEEKSTDPSPLGLPCSARALKCPRLLPEFIWDDAAVSTSLVPSGPTQAFECPRHLPGPFGVDTMVSVPLSSCGSAQALECPGLRPESFWDVPRFPPLGLPGPVQALECPRLLSQSCWDDTMVSAFFGSLARLLPYDGSYLRQVSNHDKALPPTGHIQGYIFARNL